MYPIKYIKIIILDFLPDGSQLGLSCEASDA